MDKKVQNALFSFFYLNQELVIYNLKVNRF